MVWLSASMFGGNSHWTSSWLATVLVVLGAVRGVRAVGVLDRCGTGVVDCGGGWRGVCILLVSCVGGCAVADGQQLVALCWDEAASEGAHNPNAWSGLSWFKECGPGCDWPPVEPGI